MRYPPLRVTFIYTIVAIAWIFLSDRLALMLFPTISNYQQAQTVKGIIYVLTTAMLLFLLLRADWETQKRYEVNLRREKEKLEQTLQELSGLFHKTQQLAGKLAEVEEQERTRLSRELHDKVGQNLTALSINLNILRMRLPAEASNELRERIDDTQQLVDQTMLLIRDVMTDLRPPVLDEYGLSVALRWLVEQFQNRTGINCTVQCQALDKRLPPKIENAFFRIAQAALDNIARHAEATAVDVSLRVEKGIELVIVDNGKGFDVSTASAGLNKPNWGLGIMGERAQAVGAELKVVSQPGQGTRVMVRISEEVFHDDPSAFGR